MLTAYIENTISADWDGCFQLCTEPLATDYYLQDNVLPCYNAKNSSCTSQIIKYKYITSETWKILKLYFEKLFNNTVSK